jgi:phosphatidate cytidylyltransferase
MLRTRLWVGLLLAGLSFGLILVDEWLAPWYPFLFLTLVGLMLVSCLEVIDLLGPSRRLPGWFCCAAVALLLSSNWPAFVLASVWHVRTDPWHWVLGSFTLVLLAAFVLEMITFREPGESVTRVAVTVWLTAYLGLLPCFLVQLRWQPVAAGAEAVAPSGTVALALAIFVPKGGDIGAYMTGRFLGRHRMTPLLSPKKTWEGFAGGLVAAVLVAVMFYQLDPVLRGVPLAALGFGVTVWVASVLGDLAESLIKRDCRRKDASQVVPGFGGVLDVLDSVVFAAPVAYCWLRL